MIQAQIRSLEALWGWKKDMAADDLLSPEVLQVTEFGRYIPNCHYFKGKLIILLLLTRSLSPRTTSACTQMQAISNKHEICIS